LTSKSGDNPHILVNSNVGFVPTLPLLELRGLVNGQFEGVVSRYCAQNLTFFQVL
jgi:hypothetical protein